MVKKDNDLEWRPYDLDNDYFEYLCGIVDADREDKTYIFLMRKLFDTEFSYETARLVPNDDNRIEDGLKLREDYLEETKNLDHLILCGPCSLLEMMIGLAKRIEDTFGMYDYISWFWEMVGNLELLEFDDSSYIWKPKTYDGEIIDEIICRLLNRTYSRNGDGSMFPMNKPKRDLRKTEIWYQMSNYLVERYMD